MKRYGEPYRGSKSKIAEWVIEHLPSSKILVVENTQMSLDGLVEMNLKN